MFLSIGLLINRLLFELAFEEKRQPFSRDVQFDFLKNKYKTTDVFYLPIKNVVQIWLI